MKLQVRKFNDRVLSSLVATLLFLLVSAITTSIFIGFAFATLTGVATKQFLKQREATKKSLLTNIWPEVIDHLVAGLYSGLSITEALSELANRGPS
jgi:tight adherence protein B